MNITSHIYSGCYGGETSNIADLITCVVECPSYQPSLDRKQIIFVVDESGSMVETIPAVRASLFAARNSLLRLNGLNLTGISEEIRDDIFSKTCNSCLITFSNQAVCRWESQLAYHEQHKEPIDKSIDDSIPLREKFVFFDKSFTTAVNEIEANTATNMGDALQIAFEKKILGYMTWIVLLTDGMSNKGSCQTVSGFQTLLSTMPEFTKIIPLGYTTSFDPEVLSTLGLMTYVESEENIPEIMGSITAEIATCYGVNAKINLPSLQESIVTPDDVIVVPDAIENNPRDIIGDSKIGCLFNERKFIYGRLPWGNTQSPRYHHFVGLQGTLEYFNIQTNSTVTLSFIIQNGTDQIPDEIRDAYFASSKSRILLDIYLKRQYSRFNSKYIELIKRKINDWTHPTAMPHKEEILRILNQNACLAENMRALTSAHSARAQSGYVSTMRYTTSFQRMESLLASDDALTYSASLDPATIQPLRFHTESSTADNERPPSIPTDLLSTTT